MSKIVTFFIAFFLFVTSSHSQVSFTMNSGACVNSTVLVTASTGTINNPNYTWSALPAGILFSNPNSASPVLMYSAAGNYTVILTVTSGTLISTAQSTVNVSFPPILIAVSTATSVCAGFTSTITAFGANSYTWTGSSFAGAVAQQSLSVGPGTYTVVGSNNGACLSTALSNTISLAPPLNITVSASSPTTCITSNQPKFSKPVTLNGFGAATYSWFPPVQVPPGPFPPPFVTVRPIVTTQYTVIGLTSVCSGSATITVSVIPQFTISVTPSLATICAGYGISLGLTQIGSPSLGPFTYSWTEQDQFTTTLNNTLSSTVIATPLSNRVYSLEISDNNNCVSAPTSVTVNISPCTRIDEKFTAKLWHVFPNPFDRELLIQNHSLNFYVELRDGLGRLILSREIPAQAGPEVIKTDDLNPGIYLLYIFSQGEKVQTLKFLKN